MLILANVLALSLFAADEPKAPTAPAMPKISKPRHSECPEAVEAWQLTLPEAIRIGLDNSEVIRVISLGAQSIPLGGFEPTPLTNVVGVEPANGPGLVIAPLNRDASTWKFQADVMAHVRSIEQQYWALSQQQVALWARETAVKLGEEILRRERAELEGGHATAADVAEAEQQLENFRLNLVSATSDVITTERQLRNILGLPASDDRRIVTATAPAEAKVEPDWEACLREMNASQPDLAQQKVIVHLYEMQLLMARNQLLPLMGVNTLHEFNDLGGLLDDLAPGLAGPIRRNAARRYPAGLDPSEPKEPEFVARQVGLVMTPVTAIGRLPLANTRQAQYQLLRQRAFLHQITRQTTHSLARFFLEIDANYKQFQTAQRLRVAAQQRLEAQRAFFAEGRITIDRLLDAVTQHANAIAQEAQYKTSYNTSVVALEEAKGTLLACKGITIAGPPASRNPYPSAKVDRVAPASFEGPAARPPAASRPSPTTYKVRAKLGGLPLLEVEVEVNQGFPAKAADPGC